MWSTCKGHYRKILKWQQLNVRDEDCRKRITKICILALGVFTGWIKAPPPACAKKTNVRSIFLWGRDTWRYVLLLTQTFKSKIKCRIITNIINVSKSCGKTLTCDWERLLKGYWSAKIISPWHGVFVWLCILGAWSIISSFDCCHSCCHMSQEHLQQRQSVRARAWVLEWLTVAHLSHTSIDSAKLTRHSAARRSSRLQDSSKGLKVPYVRIYSKQIKGRKQYHLKVSSNNSQQWATFIS